MDLLEVSAITKQQEGTPILNGISFTQQEFKKVAIAGETGSGKSTLLKIIAGLVQTDGGEVFFKNVKVRGPEEELIPGHPGIAYLSQQFDLLNNYRVEEVLEYANKLSEQEANTLYEVCQIDHLLKRKTNQVSGGEKQRIAIARLLIGSPKLLLLDEPYSNLDTIHKNILKTVIHDIGVKLQITCIRISHDPLDTLSWADEIIVLKDGLIVQQGSPKEIYRRPKSQYIAGLFGRYNLLDEETFRSISVGNATNIKGQRVFARPEDICIIPDAHKGIEGTITEVRFLGSAYEAEVVVANTSLTIKTNSDLKKGHKVLLTVPPQDFWSIPLP